MMKTRWQWLFDNIGYSHDLVKNKDKLIEQYIQYMFIRTQSMFEYKGLPDTIPQKDLELLLQMNGSATITEVDGKQYAFYGGLGGELNEYYLPTISTVSNPYLNFSKNLEIDKDCIVILNDPLYVGLLPMFTKYATLQAESDISLRFALINARYPKILKTDNDAAKKSAEIYLKDIEEGKKIGVMMDSLLLDEVSQGLELMDNSVHNSNIKEIIESNNYIESSWYIDLGLSSNWNNKRESINDDEVGADDDILTPLISQMLESRKQGIEKCNAKYGWNASVELGDRWKKIHEQMIENNVSDNMDEGGDDNEDSRNDIESTN